MDELLWLACVRVSLVISMGLIATCFKFKRKMKKKLQYVIATPAFFIIEFNGGQTMESSKDREEIQKK